MENWKEVKGYEDIYEVSDFGNVRNKKTSKLIKPSASKEYGKDGSIQYIRYRVKLYKDGKGKSYTIARLVGDAFIPNPNNYETIDHIDKDTSNNKVSNLRWMSREKNSSGHTVVIHNNRKVLCIETNIEYPSVEEAARQLKLKNAASIRNAINPNDRHKTAGGYHWKYID